MGRQRKKQLCIYCNERYSTSTGDHVPPQGMFPGNIPQVVVPCCYQCNNDYSEIDEIMRNKLSFLSTYVPKEVQDRTIRSIQKTPAKFPKLDAKDVIDTEGRQRIMI